MPCALRAVSAPPSLSPTSPVAAAHSVSSYSPIRQFETHTNRPSPSSSLPSILDLPPPPPPPFFQAGSPSRPDFPSFQMQAQLGFLGGLPPPPPPIPRTPP